ncbi:hypothetical protein [Seonamhaeicola marinus]|uniref:Uncharacterized protein n=1 Tax=Seonamhaeicola marinus TaxID=1912246 RepID=A0A5D0HKA9_9FLAO|nr:hypothetical protein [Seonamhaeicola marinus]TYA71400.1 hypothetical protein FUA24_17605 [Seonamhaeicola marinus]
MLNKEKLECLSELVDTSCISSEEFVECLDKGIEMLFYIEENTFDRKEIQNVVFAIRSVIKALKKN